MAAAPCEALADGGCELEEEEAMAERAAAARSSPCRTEPARGVTRHRDGALYSQLYSEKGYTADSPCFAV